VEDEQEDGIKENRREKHDQTQKSDCQKCKHKAPVFFNVLSAMAARGC